MTKPSVEFSQENLSEVTCWKTPLEQGLCHSWQWRGAGKRVPCTFYGCSFAAPYFTQHLLLFYALPFCPACLAPLHHGKCFHQKERQGSPGSETVIFRYG